MNNRLPYPLPLDVSHWSNVVAFAPHADDEVLGCGGLLALLAEQNVPTHTVLVSDSSGAGGLPEGAGIIRAQEFIDSLASLHPSITHELWHLPDGQLLESMDSLVQQIDAVLQTQQADTLISPWYMDMHPDHSAVGHAVLNVAKKHASSIKRVVFYEVWSPLPATHVLDISPWWPRKVNALLCHKTALECGSYIRAMTGLASYRALVLPTMAAEGSFAEAYYVQPLP